MTEVKKILNDFKKELAGIYPQSEIEAVFFRLLEYYHKHTRIDLSLTPRLSVDEDSLINALKRLKKNEPWQYITGEDHFNNCRFILNKNVLIPRPETEELVNLIIQENDNKHKLNILDIGTGSGAIAVCLSKHFNNSKVFALDFSSKAIEIAKKNAQLNNVDVKFIEQNILQKFICKTKFDIIVSNPPYVRFLEKEMMHKNVLDYEPASALFVEDDSPLVFYDKIIDFYIQNRSNKGILYFEINEYLKTQLATLLQQKEINKFSFKKDIFDKWRILKICI